MTTAALTGRSDAGWLRSRRFDLTLIVGVAALALASGAAVTLEARLFLPILLADLWLLGYHHVIATYTRLAFDRTSLREHRWLVFALPVPVLLGTAALAGLVGGWAVATLYFYWQWFHYTRQSWGLMRAYARKGGNAGTGACSGRLFAAAFYLVPLWGILLRSAQSPDTFLGLGLATLPVPYWAADACGVAALAALAAWVALRLVRDRARLTGAEGLYLASHFAIFAVGYLLIRDVNHGWLVINVWHNAQYILFVWLFNARRFRDGPEPGARFLSAISQPHRAWAYALVCLGLSTAVYAAISSALAGAELWALPAAMIVFQAANFHHYIVDGLIWRSRRRGAARS